ncbi:MAG: DUF374 domain-containing protein [Elusimicrobia bacterium]|nr:DUF374 domain-containing protein [Elusimicrobiota bacterium]
MMAKTSLPFKDRFLAWVVSWFSWFLLQFIGRTSRVHSHYHPKVKEYFKEGKPFIYALWHRFQLFMVYEHRNRGVHVLVSQSRDGELIARALDRFGFYTVRGSSSHGGRAAFIELLNRARDGKSVAFTPDGPRGPYRAVRPGVIAMARKTGLPVVPLAWAGSRVKELSSWDRFLIPLPFGRFHVVLGAPFWIQPGDEKAEEKVRLALDDVALQAEQRLQRPAAHPPGLLKAYSLLLFLMWPLVFLGFVWRYGLRRTLKGLGERFGFGLPKKQSKNRPLIWIHAASVGEVRAVEGYLRNFPRTFPHVTRLLTTTTISGKELAEKLCVADEVRLAPMDLSFCVKRLAARMSPIALVLVETELWPNWIRALGDLDVPLFLINGRLSDRSFRAYFLMRFFWKPLLRRFSVIAVQNNLYAERFTKLGADPAQVAVTGNLKSDIPAPDLSRRPGLFRKFGFEETDRVWVCGSTHEGEEEVLADVFLSLLWRDQSLKLVLAPRHIERAPNVCRLLERKGLPHHLRSQIAEGTKPSVLILDTVGELADVYGLATWAYVGGSLIPRGGQNPLEPARWGVPVLFGPHMENFRDTSKLLIQEKAALQVKDAKMLEEFLYYSSRNPATREAMGQAARRVAEAQQGAVANNYKLLQDLMKSLDNGSG